MFALSKRIFSIQTKAEWSQNHSVYYLCEQHSKTTEISNLLTVEDQKIVPGVASPFPKEYFLSMRTEWFQNHYQCTIFASNIKKLSKFLIFLTVEDQKIIRPFQKNILYPQKQNDPKIIQYTIFASNIQKPSKFLIF